MENPSFVRNGEIKLPIGFRFHPTDEELVVHYLRRKALSWPLPASVIPELDVFHSNPWNLPGDLKEKRYFFSKRNGNGINNRCITTRVVLSTGSGYWKAVGKKKHIVASQTNQAVGMKRTLVFYQGKSPHVSRTSWVMHEYTLLGFQTPPNLTQKTEMEVEDWVVHKVFEKKRRVERNKVMSQQSNNINNRTNNTNNHEVVINPICIDYMVEENFDLGPPQASSSCSSELTDDQASSNGTTTTDQEETSGHLKISLLSSYSSSCMMMRKH